MSRLLLVDDDTRLRRALGTSLAARRFTVEEASSGREALKVLATLPTDLVLLDLGLPDTDGLALIPQIRSVVDAPIIVLSARQQESDKVDALEAGADDYVTKPFGLEELVARIRVAIRRTQASEQPAVVATGSFRLDFLARRARHRDRDVHLTTTEWRLAEALVRRSGTMVPTRDLLAEVWGPSFVEATNYVRVYIAALRRKLEDDPAHPVYFVTVVGEGYRFEP